MALDTSVAQTAVDFQGLAALRRDANVNQHDPKTIRKVASQFESIFIGMMLKSMRKAKLSEGIFDSSQSDMYRDIADQQMAINLANHGGLGLQDVIMRQLSGHQGKSASPSVTMNHSVASIPVRPALLPAAIKAMAPSEAAQSSKSEVTTNQISFDSPQDFIQKLWPMAKKAADKLGVTPEVILSQAALETGWGKHIIDRANGNSSYNLFNIKATNNWQGKQAVVNTVEYRNGVAVKQPAHFRAYDSYQQSFDDYVNFLQSQPRYHQALQHTDDPAAFIDALHKAGYATDPGYADKVKRIMQGDTLAQNSPQLKNS